MRINELRGYRNDPVYKKIKGLEKNLSNLDTNLRDFRYYLQQHGFENVNNGIRGIVFKHPTKNYIIKIFVDAAYLEFINLTKQFPSIYFPKFLGNVMNISDKIKAVKIEKLNPITDALVKKRFIHAFNIFFRNDTSNMELYKMFQTMFPGLQEIACQMYNNIQKNQFSLDLHGGNIMQRDDGQIVIIDPFIDHF